jgi:hypothetical protein
VSHFGEARHQVEQYFTTRGDIRSRLARVCLVWDLRGRLRLLIEPAPGMASEPLVAELKGALAGIASYFWTGEVWVARDSASASERAVYEAAWAAATPHSVPGPPELRLLERHVSKDAWFVPRVQPPWPLNEHTPPILAFYSFKGGVGRTTALLSLAVQLARQDRNVVLVDLDLEAPGLLAALPPAGTGPAAGVLDFLLERPLVARWRDLTMADFYYTVDASQVIGAGAPLRVIPAGRLDEYYLQKLARVNYQQLYALTSGATERSPIGELLGFARTELKADYVLLDSRAGFHDLGGLALSGIAHLDVVFGLHSEQSWRGLEMLVRFLGRDRVERGLAQLDCLLVQAMAPAPGEERERAFALFKERAYERFSEDYYDEEGSDGEWPLPGLDDEDEPHYPVALAFDPLVQRYQTIADVADRLTQGDFATFAQKVLNRLGRKTP